MAWKSWTWISLLLAASVIPFSGSLRNQFVWDDHILLTERLAPQRCSGLGDVWSQPFWGPARPADTYRPVGLSLIYIEHQLFGEQVAPYRIVSLALHAAATLLFAVLMDALLPAAAFGAALLFAVHPIHAEAVAMVYGQLELLAAILILLCALFYLRARQDGFRAAPFAAALLCAMLAAGCKESAMMLPLLLLLVQVCWWKRKLAAWDALFLLALTPYLVLRYEALGSLAPEADATVTLGYGAVLRVKTVIISLGHAIRLLLFPTGQTLYYGHLRDSLLGWPVLEAGWILVGVSLLWFLRSRIGDRLAIFGGLWFLLTIAPVANIVPSGVLVAERTLYLPSMGICLLAAAWACSSNRLRVPAAVVVAASILASVHVMGKWRDDETLWRTTVADHPRSPAGQLWLGRALLERQRKSGLTDAELQEATAAFAKARELNPDLEEALAGSQAVEAIRRNRRQQPDLR